MIPSLFLSTFRKFKLAAKFVGNKNKHTKLIIKVVDQMAISLWQEKKQVVLEVQFYKKDY